MRRFFLSAFGPGTWRTLAILFLCPVWWTIMLKKSIFICILLKKKTAKLESCAIFSCFDYKLGHLQYTCMMLCTSVSSTISMKYLMKYCCVWIDCYRLLFWTLCFEYVVIKRVYFVHILHMIQVTLRSFCILFTMW